MPKINENCFVKCMDGRTNWVKKMNELGKQEFKPVWQTYTESDDEQVFSAYFYREVFISKKELLENKKK